MKEAIKLPVVSVARHGKTPSTVSQQTGVTDIARNAQGEGQAVRFGERLPGLGFTIVLTSPRC